MSASALVPFPLCTLLTMWALLCSGMVYDDAEKLYAEVRTDTEALTEDALRVIYPGSCALSSASSEPQTLFAHNTTPFARRDIVRVSNSTANVLQATSDEKEGYVVMEGGPGGGLVLPSQISVQDLKGVTAESANGEHFVLKNENVRLTVSGGRITSLFDVKLRCVSFLFDLRYRSTIDRSFQTRTYSAWRDRRSGDI